MKQSDAGVEIAMPKSDRQEIDTIVALELDKAAIEIQPIAVKEIGQSLTTGKRASTGTVKMESALKECYETRQRNTP